MITNHSGSTFTTAVVQKNKKQKIISRRLKTVTWLWMSPLCWLVTNTVRQGSSWLWIQWVRNRSTKLPCLMIQTKDLVCRISCEKVFNKMSQSGNASGFCRHCLFGVEDDIGVLFSLLSHPRPKKKKIVSCRSPGWSKNAKFTEWMTNGM